MIKLIKWNWNMDKQKWEDCYDNVDSYIWIRIWLNEDLDKKYLWKKCKSKKAFIRFLKKHIIPTKEKCEVQLVGRYIWQNSLIYIQ